MRTTAAVVLCTAMATALLAFGVGTATARNFSVSNQNIRATFHEIEFVAGSVTNTCDVTLEGSLHARTIPKVLNSLIGYVTRVEVSNCRVVTTVLTETLPWHVRFRGFSGNLPNISLLIGRARATFRVATCLAEAELESVIVRNPATGELISGSKPSVNVPLTGVLCPAPRLGTLRSNGSGRVSVLNSSTLITITLI